MKVLSPSTLTGLFIFITNISSNPIHPECNYDVRCGDDCTSFVDIHTRMGIEIEAGNDHVELRLFKEEIGKPPIYTNRVWLNNDGTGVKYPDNEGEVKSAVSFKPDMTIPDFIDFFTKLYPGHFDQIKNVFQRRTS